ncbi:MAG: hypothetical protein BWY67_00557 [Bacteroidetes bacterium ADurb.Bin397]|nr:MAG: hypothetical protein BWY67_00557 [Bacteroidetes bacterium ADurb.Bin397]
MSEACLIPTSSDPHYPNVMISDTDFKCKMCNIKYVMYNVKLTI